MGLIAGCGSGDPVGRAPSGLPTEQLALVGDLCPTRSELKLAGARATRARARRQLDALKRAFRKDPDAEVETTYYPSDGGVGKETLTLRALVKEHLKAVPEGLAGPPKAQSVRCTRRLERELRGLLEDT